MIDGIERAADALQAIPPDLPRPEWVRVGMAAKAAGVEFDTFDAWSADGSNYDAHAARDTWKSLKADGGIGPGTLYRMAADYGWHADGKPHATPPKPARKPAPARELKPRPGLAPADVWARCEPATNAHGYIVKKRAAGVDLSGLRVVPQGDALTIRGQSMAGALAVPALGAGGGLQSLQFIPADGPKMNLPGASMAGASFIVGERIDGQLLYACEGLATAWACWQATGCAAVVCFGWGNVRKVAERMHEKDAATRLVLVPDAGKETDAEKMARELGIAWVAMPEGSPSNFDAWDLKERDGPDALVTLLESAKVPEPPPPLLVPVSVADVLTHPAPPPRFVWDGYAPRGVVTLLGAHGGVGKSTVALMLAAAVATGRPLFSVDTERSPVLFVSLEDAAATVRHRLAWICKAWAIEPAELADLRIVDGTANPELFAAERRDGGETTAAYAELRTLATGAGLVVIDNASDAYGADEIQRRQVRAFIRALAEIAKANDAAVLLLAHVDKATSKQRKAEGGEGYSGSTAWNNSVRSRLFMTRDESGALTLEHQKSNFGPMREPLTLEWPTDGLPCVVQALSPVVQGISDKNDTRALLRLIHEFSERGERVSTATTGPAAVTRIMGGERAYPKRKPADVVSLLRDAERKGYLRRGTYRNDDYKVREIWCVTPEGESFAEIPHPPIPPIPPIDELAEPAERAERRGGATAPAYRLGGVGELAERKEPADSALSGAPQ